MVTFDPPPCLLLYSIAEIRRKFMEYDRDGNGVVTMDEAHDILQKELSFTPQQSIELVRRYDKNGDGQLSYEEFAKFYDKVKFKYVCVIRVKFYSEMSLFHRTYRYMHVNVYRYILLHTLPSYFYGG